MKTKEILGILMLFLCTFSFISCSDDNDGNETKNKHQ